MIGLSALLKEFDLHLLDFGEALPLPVDEMVHLFVQVPDFEFRLQVDLIVVPRAQSILCLLTPLVHHDDGSLNGGDAGQNEVEKDVGVWVKGLRPSRRVDADPSSQTQGEKYQERPTPAERGKPSDRRSPNVRFSS